MKIPEEKNKREKRILQKGAHVARQVRIAKSHGQPVKEEHRFAKHNAMDCGVPNCPMCSNPRHNKSVKHRLTVQEVKSNTSMKEYLSE